MGKNKKQQKGRQEEDFGEGEVDHDVTSVKEDVEDGVNNLKTAGKKGQKSRRKDDWEDDVAQELQMLSLDKQDNKTGGKKDKKESEKKSKDDTDMDVQPSNKRGTKKKGKGGDSDEENFEESSSKIKRKGRKGQISDDEDNEVDVKKKEIKGGKKKGNLFENDELSTKSKKGNKGKLSDDDDSIEEQKKGTKTDDLEGTKGQKKHKGKEKNEINTDKGVSDEGKKEIRQSKKKAIENLKSLDQDSENEQDFVSKAGKKAKKKKGKAAAEEEDDVDNLISENKSAKTKKGKKKGKELDSDEEDQEYLPKKQKATKSNKSAFHLLNTEDLDMEIDQGSDDAMDFDKEEISSKTSKNKVEILDQEISDTEQAKKEEKGGKKSKKKDRKKKQDDEEVEKMLEELALEIEGKKPQEKTKEKSLEPPQTADGTVDETEGKSEENVEKSKKKKKKKVESEIPEMVEQSSELAEEESTVKSAAQKKKDKKERERQKKLTQSAQERSKKTKEENKSEDSKPVEEEIAKEELKPSAEGEEEGKKKKDEKKKKGAKKDEEEDTKKDKKRPGRKQIAAMQEALLKIKEEEEKRLQEQAAKQAAAEEAERQRLEKLRLEQEKKERKKLKEKEKRQQLKQAGKLLTPAQKLARSRMEATLQVLRQQGVDVPQIGEKKERAPRLGDRRRPPKKKPEEQQQEQQAAEEITSELQKVEVEIVGPTDAKEELSTDQVQEEIKESWEEEEEDDVKDAWDDTSTEEEEEDDNGKEVPKHEAKSLQSEKVEGSDEDSEEESEEESESESESEEEESEDEEDKRKREARTREKVLQRIQKRREDAEKNRTTDKLRSPVVCVLGHVDTGKTKILDKIRRTHVQDSEAGGITQQIGATMVPQEALREQCKMVKTFTEMELKVPGLLIIDTPGHESFSNLRSRGSSLCDIAILVVDIMHGIEPQTLESINLLKQKKTPFVVALNKIDRLYEWRPMKSKDVQDVIKGQARNTKMEFDERTREIITQFAEQGLNAALFYENKDPRTYISMIPTSAFSGDGMGNLLALIVELTQTMMTKRLAFTEELQATVLEVKAIPGLGTTIDVILVNGRLKEGDTIVLAGHDGAVTTQIRSLLMPQPLKELRVKNPYQEFREVEGAQGVKIAGKDLDKAIAGLQLMVAHQSDEVDILKEEVNRTFREAMSSIKLAERGVYVQASTLGSLEALLEFLRSSKIPYSGVRIGPVVKKDIMKASIMLEHDNQYAVILAFDVKVERDAQELADSLGVKIFQADIIYHLFDKFMAYRDELKQKKRDEFKHIAVFPCKLRILPHYIFNSRDPIVVGVSVEAGVVKEGTPLCVPSREFLEIGTVTTIEVNHKPMESARKGQEVCLKIESLSGDSPKMYGRHFEHTDILVSKITRQSIDACKEYFRDDLLKTDWQLMVELKKMFQIL